MFDKLAFEKCIRANLKDRRFGKERADEIIDEFNARKDVYTSAGKNETDASLMAMNDTFENMGRLAAEKAKRTAKMLSVQALNTKRIEEGLSVNTKLFDTKGVKGSRGKAVAQAAISLIEHDPRFKGLSYSGVREIVRGQLFAVMEDVVSKAGKGVFGRQRGKAHLKNIIREVFGESTNDASARELAQGWNKTSNLGVDLFNEAGGSMNKLDNYLPDPMTSTAKLNGADLRGIKNAKSLKAKDLQPAAFKRFQAIAREHWDWDRMTWPDGSRIEPKDREAVIEQVFRTKTLDGANKLDPKAFRGQGRAVGNAIEQHRFVHYKDAEGWLKAHEQFGDGTIFDVMVRHVDDMAHRIALVDTFGPNPELTYNNIEAIVKSKLLKYGDQEIAKADAVLKNRFRPMLDIASRANPMDPHSVMGNIGTGLSNVLTSAQLGAASLLAIPGDAMQTLMTRMANKQPLWGGVDYYFKAIATDPEFMRDISVQSGFIHDDFVTSVYATTRYTGVDTVGPALTRRLSDGVMRLSLMSGHTRAARTAVQNEFMGMMYRMRDMKFEDLPFNKMMERYGITAEDWDVMRKLKPYQPKKGVNFMRPMDILEGNAVNKTDLFRKFQGMIIEEARTGVPEATIQSTVTLKGSERPDTLRGLLLHSFAMYKNFPVSFFTIYGRLALASDSVGDRLAFVAGLGMGMTLVGALGTQMKEVAKGRDPLPMDDPRFWGKSMLSGGALSIWGDFLFAGVGRYGEGPEDIVGGPLVGFFGDTTNLVFGDMYRAMVAAGQGEEYGLSDIRAPAEAVKWAKRYTPGSSIWWARLALERQIWDRLEEVADPKAYRKRRNRMKKQRKEFGNEYWWPQGERSPERLPEYQGRD